ncbi:MAG: GNAT family N-acetyltransferase [Acidobacteria bacterium]|nr:GNAT family N-acetyltransferase [Acidobacteriota bacterium]
MEAIVALDAVCFSQPFRFSRAAMRQFAEAENASTAIAETPEGIAGFCIVHLEESEGATIGYLVTIDVDERFRREGLGQRLLASVEEWVRESGGEAMYLHVYLKNEAAIGFYERSGYRSAGEQRGFYGPGIDAVLYWKQLDLAR